jgi:dolichol-phosphate mannosyltransferase
VKTLIAIPTYNERENVGPMCEQIVALGLDADLLFLDDSSPDGTGAALDVLAAKHPRVRVIHRPAKAGIGAAHFDGIGLAYDEGYARLVTLDCDFTHSPDLIPVFLARGATADVVVGSRYIQSDSLPGWTLVRKALTSGGHLLTKTLLGLAEDATGAFRAYDLARIPREVFGLVRSRGYSFFFESLLILSRNGFSIAEVPIKLPARTAGHSKMSYVEIRRSVMTLATLFWASQREPDRFLLPAKRRPR